MLRKTFTVIAITVAAFTLSACVESAPVTPIAAPSKEEVLVPVVIGLTPDEAEVILKDAGFEIQYANGEKPANADSLLISAEFVNMKYVVDETFVANKGEIVTVTVVPADEYENPIGDKNPNQ